MHLIHDKQMDRRRCQLGVDAHRVVHDQDRKRGEQEINSFRSDRVRRDGLVVLRSIATIGHRLNNLVSHLN